MKKVEIGRTGIKVSELCLGTMYLGTKLNQSKSEGILDYYVDQGGNFIDTSNNYAFWMNNGVGDESECIIGGWLKRKNRDDIIIATKCGARPTFFDGDLANVQLEGLSQQTIITAVEDSLKRLKTDYIDILYGHVDFIEYPIEERLAAFSRLKKSGKIRAVGTSNTWAWRIEESNRYSRENHLIAYSCVQQKYSYLRPKYSADFWVQKLVNDELIEYCYHHRQVSLLAYSTLLSGLYANSDPIELPEEYNTEDNRYRMEVLGRIAEEIGCTKNQLILAWMMNHKTRIIPIISGSKPNQIQESIGACELYLSKDQLKTLFSAGQ